MLLEAALWAGERLKLCVGIISGVKWAPAKIYRRVKRFVYCLKLLLLGGRWVPSGVILDVFGGRWPVFLWIHRSLKTGASGPGSDKHTSLHLPALFMTAPLRVQSYARVHRSVPAMIKKSHFLLDSIFMNPVDLCSLHVPTGDYYTVQSHYCNKTCIVLELIWVIMRSERFTPLPTTVWMPSCKTQTFMGSLFQRTTEKPHPETFSCQLNGFSLLWCWAPRISAAPFRDLGRDTRLHGKHST